MSAERTHQLDRPVVPGRDHVLGPSDAPITLVEYGSYACPRCRAVNEQIAKIRDQFGDRLRYVFRHKPLTGNDLALRAAELVEQAETPEQFWKAHIALMTRSPTLTEEDLSAIASNLGLPPRGSAAATTAADRAKAHVAADLMSAQASGALLTPTFFINGRRYDGPWDEVSFADALLGSLGHRVRTAALEFAAWTPALGVLLLLASLVAVALTNSPFAAGFSAFWHRSLGFTWGDTGYQLPLLNWVNDGLLSIFFLVVGLEIKREFTIGHLSSRRLAALPVAAAIGGMVVPASLYALAIPGGPWASGWGVPMATDTAFAVALIAMMGKRVPVELRIFLTAAAIVDDIGAITVVALFYSSDLHSGFLVAALAIVGLLMLLNKSGIYRVAPYALLGLALWVCVHEGGIHATLAGVVLALLIPTRPPPNLSALMAQADTIIAVETSEGPEGLGHRLSTPALQALDAIHDRLESPAARVLRHVEPWSSYVVLPVFALANAGVALTVDVLDGHESLFAAITLGLVVGKPVGMVLVPALAVRLGLATKPAEYSWMQVIGAGALSGIGFTMSLFIAGQAFPLEADFAAAKIAVFSASLLSAIIGVAILGWAGTKEKEAS
ncbi:Na+/H+ antiporter NhaA [Nitrosococcus halophilus Nc 4]|uniref:Na(+)/H(+) antiporter NhaA n=1 Tax=Nitrosococcus halophilus (strain Nc4) TaxID=472759 RepID=D5C2Z1_NITHN|nr:Na+/H+ antiporter NhaA [Nitrosococcus halophilus]ADE14883.1 Na+/H+ antiporter NhaA [Nitrosococcus halophilus Nc 4]